MSRTWHVQVILSKHIRITMEKQCNTYRFMSEKGESKIFRGPIRGEPSGKYGHRVSYCFTRASLMMIHVRTREALKNTVP